jgi:2'-5' RNA ligase
MVAALECYLDTHATRRVRALWDAYEAAGIPSLRGLADRRHRPHVSLVAADVLDPRVVAAALDGMPVAPPLRLDFQYVGQFVGRVVWLGPSPTAELLSHHEQVYARLAAAGIEVYDVYRPGAWVPHCTLSMGVPADAACRNRPRQRFQSMITEAVRLALEVLPITATITAAAVADHNRGVHHALPALKIR